MVGIRPLLLLACLTLGVSCFKVPPQPKPETKSARGFLVKGLSSLQLGCLQEAEWRLKRGLGAAHRADDIPMLVEIHLSLGRLFEERAQPEAANDHYRRAALHAQHARLDGLALRARALEALASDAAAESEASLEKVFQRDCPLEGGEGCAFLESALGVLAQRRGETALARQRFESAQRRNGEPPADRALASDLYLHLGRLDEASGDLEAAEAKYRNAREIDIDISNPRGLAEDLHRLSNLYRAADRKSDALSAGLRALGLYETLGNAEKMGELFESLIALAEDPAMRQGLERRKASLETEGLPDRCR